MTFSLRSRTEKIGTKIITRYFDNDKNNELLKVAGPKLQVDYSYNIKYQISTNLSKQP